MAEPKNISVAGDLIMDWNIARAQESDRSGTLWDPNCKAQAFRQFGGAALLCDGLQATAPSAKTYEVELGVLIREVDLGTSCPKTGVSGVDEILRPRLQKCRHAILHTLLNGAWVVSHLQPVNHFIAADELLIDRPIDLVRV